MDLQLTKQHAQAAGAGDSQKIVWLAQSLGHFLGEDKKQWDFLARWIEEVRGGSPALGACCDAIMDGLKKEAARSMQPVVGDATAKLASGADYTPLSPQALKAIFAEFDSAGDTQETCAQCLQKLAQQLAAALRTPVTTYPYGERNITDISFEIFRHEVFSRENKQDSLHPEMKMALLFLQQLATTVSYAQRTNELPNMQNLCTGTHPERFLPDPQKTWSQPDWELLHRFATQPAVARATTAP